MRILVLFLLLAGTAVAEPAPAVRIAEPSPGMASDDHVLYTLDATAFGADRTGRTDATAAIQAALDACDRAAGGTVFLPAGRYRVEGALELKGGCTLRGEWMDPEKGGLGKGTVLMAFAGRGEAEPDRHPLLRVPGGACLRDLSVWYPEQTAAAPVPYPATICGRGHSTVFNVTLYNSWCGFWNNGCSSMLVRRLYGTPLKLGVHGAYAYDIPRIETVHFSPKYWAGSGLPGAPSGRTLAQLTAFLEENLVCIQAGEQDWGYWWDLDFDHCRRGLFLTAVPSDDGKKLVPGNICAGNVRIRNAAVGVYLANAGYPGFMLTYGDISARVCPLYFADRPDYSEYEAKGLKPQYQSASSLLVTGVTFRGGKYGVGSNKTGPYGINLSDCTFEGYTHGAVRADDGSVTVSRSRFKGRNVPAFSLKDPVRQLVLLGNAFAGATLVSGWAADDPRILRDDADTSVPVLTYSFDHVSRRRPATRQVWDVVAFGAARGTWEKPPEADSTAAIQKALDAAGAAKGGTVYVPAGVYRLDGGLVVPSGVELRGSFEGAHYGNSTMAGTQFWAYGGKDRPDAAPLVTLRPDSGFKGFSVFYPEQGWSDRAGASEAARAKKYPPTVRTASDCWVQNLTVNCGWTAVDAMTVKSDRLELADLSGAVLGATLEYGHGAVDGVVRNVHFNYSSWTHQSKFPNRPRKEQTEGGLVDFATRNVKGLVLGDLRNCAFFSCFNIIVAEQLVLEKDRYTGGSFHGKTWGIAFDAAHNGVLGRADCEAKIALIASMGVFNQQGGGFYAVTDPAFRGHVVFSNADVWSGYSRIADVHGGAVTFSQLLSWCCLEADCHAGGLLNMLACTYAGDHVGDNDRRPCLRYEAGAKGRVTGTVECRKRLTFLLDPAASVKLGRNGFTKPLPGTN